MRLTRSIVPPAVLALVVALGAPQVASARGLDRADRPLLAPTHRVDGIDAGEAMGRVWGIGYTLPAGQNLTCVRLGRHSQILLPHGSEEVPCTVDSNTTILRLGECSNTCDTVDPLSPWYAVGKRAQRRRMRGRDDRAVRAGDPPDHRRRSTD